MTFVISFYTLIPPLASSMMAPALPEIVERFDITSPTVVALTPSIFLLTFAFGPLIFGPLSEIYGRKWELDLFLAQALHGLTIRHLLHYVLYVPHTLLGRMPLCSWRIWSDVHRARFGFCLLDFRRWTSCTSFMSANHGGKGRPELRLPNLIVCSFIVPIGLFWYSWCAQARLHWMMPIIGTAIYGFGVFGTFIPIQLYLVDTFTYAASALATAAVFHSLFGFGFPLFGEQMLNKLRYGGVNSLLAGLAIVLGIPFPIWLSSIGEQMRAKGSLAQ